MSFGADTILDKVTFGIHEGDRLGVVGVNGAGKSLLLKVIAGKVRADSGSVSLSKDLRVAYLEQNAGFESERALFDEMLLAFPDMLRDEERMTELGVLLEEPLPAEEHVRLAREYTSLEERFRKSGGYEYRSRIKSMLERLGFDEQRQKMPINTLSGGQKTRVALAAALLREPDILMLDEPTNHLDISTVAWLEEYLISFRKTLIVISHDRYFLDKVTNKTLDIENASAKLYNSSYSGFVKQKEKDREIDERHYKNQRREIERLEAFIENQRRWNRERNIIAAESRMKAIDRMEKLERPDAPPDTVSMSFRAGATRLLSDNILDVRSLSKSYPGKPLFSNISFTVHSGDRLFVFGDNGVGKSTLLKILSGKLAQDSGGFEYINKIKIGYYDQENQGLSPENTILEELWSSYPDKKQSEIRGVLARFLFKADDVFKQVKVLSGGEKARLTFAKLMLDELNLLIFDEPTNHLDASTREILEEALAGYDGTLIAVSHDRYFIKKLANRIIEMSNDRIFDYKGGYEDFCEYKQKKVQETQSTTGENTQVGAGKESYIRGKQEKSRRRKAEKTVADCERGISECEKLLSELDTQIAECGSDYVKTAELFAKTEEVSTRLEGLYEEWDRATAILAEFDET